MSIQAVTDENDLMIINRSGISIRTGVDQIRLAGRATQGVKIINLREGDAIASVVAVPGNEEPEEAVGTENDPTLGNAAGETANAADNANETENSKEIE